MLLNTVLNSCVDITELLSTLDFCSLLGVHGTRKQAVQIAGLSARAACVLDLKIRSHGEGENR